MNNFNTLHEEARNVLRIANAKLRETVNQGDFHDRDFGNFHGLAWEMATGMRPAQIKKQYGVKDHYDIATTETFIKTAEAVERIIDLILSNVGTYKEIKEIALSAQV
ncbi:MAG TPA: hypothetical protein VGM95_00085 [Lactobacillaceae bacterium]|jgi:hypothetical protein